MLQHQRHVATHQHSCDASLGDDVLLGRCLDEYVHHPRRVGRDRRGNVCRAPPSLAHKNRHVVAWVAMSHVSAQFLALLAGLQNCWLVVAKPVAHQRSISRPAQLATTNVLLIKILCPILPHNNGRLLGCRLGPVKMTRVLGIYYRLLKRRLRKFHIFSQLAQAFLCFVIVAVLHN